MLIASITMVESCLEPRPALIGPDNTTGASIIGSLVLRRALGLDVISCVWG